jgi:hypothetical protein
MKGTTRFTSSWTFFAIVAAAASLFPAVPIAAAQTQSLQGQDAVYNSSAQVTNSPSFIDASMFAFNNGTICSVIYNILTSTNPPYPSGGAVVDARGLANSTPATSMTCTTAHPSPWAGIANPLPSTILLPAGTIVIPSGWVLPKSTRLIGEGDGIPSNGLTPGTTIQAASGFSGTMIQFGSTASTGIAVEHLTLDGQGQLGQSVNGIANAESQANSYVDHVSLYRILGTGQSVSGTANDSGPYSNITFDPGTAG